MSNQLAQLLSAEHDAEAAQLRSEGWTVPEIAKHQGVKNETVSRRIGRAIKRVPVEAVNELRKVQQSQLDLMYREALKVLRADHIVVNNGNVIRDPRTGEPLKDDAPVLQAIGVMLKVQDRLARLYGLDAPSRALTMTASEEAVDRQIQILLKESGQYGQVQGDGRADDDYRGAVGETPAIEAVAGGEEGAGLPSRRMDGPEL